MVSNKKRKPVFIKRKWNYVVFSRATILSFHPVIEYDILVSKKDTWVRKLFYPVGWSWRIHRLHLCRWVQKLNDSLGYNTEQYDGEVPIMLELWEMQNIPSLPLLTGPFWSGVVTPDRRCPWYYGYRRWKWTRRYEFQSWTRLIAFHIALIHLGKVWFQLFFLQLCVNSRTDWLLQPWWGN